MVTSSDRTRVGQWLLVAGASLAVAGSYFLPFFYGAALRLAVYLGVALPLLGVAVPRLAAAPARTRWAAAAASAVVGAAILLVFGVVRGLAPPVVAVLVILLATLASGWIAVVAARVALPRLAACTLAGVVWRLVAALAAGVLFAGLLSPLPVLPAFHRLEVVATGERAPAAQGTEVWFLGVFAATGGAPLAGTLTHDERWSRRDERWLASGTEPASLVWQGWLVADASVHFVSHPWSGKVRVLWDGERRDVDLFSPEGREAVVGLPYHPAAASPAYRILRGGAASVVLGLLVLVAGCWSGAPPPVPTGLDGHRRRAAVVTALAYLIVLGAFLATRGPFFLAYPLAGAFADSIGYVKVAQNIAAGTLPPLTIRPPGYPLFLLVARLVSPDSITLLVLQGLVTLGTALLVVFAFRRFGPWPAVAAAICYGALLASDAFIAFETTIMSDSLYANLVVTSAACLILAVTSRDWRWFFLHATAVGAVILVRPAGLFLVVIAVALALYGVWTRASWKCAAAAVVPWLVMLNGLCLYNVLTMGSYLVSAWGTANLVGATGTFWVPRPGSPEALARQADAFTATIAPEDARTLAASWDPDTLFPIYTRYYNRAFFGDPGAMGFLRDAVGAEDLTADDERFIPTYLAWRAPLAALVRQSIVGRPRDYLRFVWTTSWVGLFSDQSSDLRLELDRRAGVRRQGPGAAGAVSFGGWFSDLAPGGVSPEDPPAAEASRAGFVRLYGALREWNPGQRLLHRRAFWIAALGVMGAMLLATGGARGTLGFVACAFALYWIGTMLTVALVELTIPRYLFPAYFVVYLAPAFVVALFAPGDPARE